MPQSASMTTRNPATAYALVATIGMAVIVGSALGFEYIGGYMPCHLCLLERNPYYIGIPIGVVAVLTAALRLPARLTQLLLLIIGILMLVGFGMGVYHAGVEWGFWAGPSSCTSTPGSATKSAGDLLSALNTVHGPQCDQAALRILGISLAGWNAVACLVLAIIAFLGVKKAA